MPAPGQFLSFNHPPLAARLAVEQNSRPGPHQDPSPCRNQTTTHIQAHPNPAKPIQTQTRTKATAVRIKPQLMFTFLTTAKEKFALPAENSAASHPATHTSPSHPLLGHLGIEFNAYNIG